MHLLPQSFVFQVTHPPPKGRLTEQRHSSSQPLFNSFESLPHLLPRQAFRFDTSPEFRRQSRLPCSTSSPDFETIVDPYGSRDEGTYEVMKAGNLRLLWRRSSQTFPRQRGWMPRATR